MKNIQERALAIGTGPVQEKEHLFAGRSGQAVAHGSLQKVDEALVAIHDAVKERQPEWARRPRVELDGCTFGDQVCSSLFVSLAGSRINRATLAIQQPDVAIQVIGQNGDAA